MLAALNGLVDDATPQKRSARVAKGTLGCLKSLGKKGGAANVAAIARNGIVAKARGARRRRDVSRRRELIARSSPSRRARRRRPKGVAHAT